MNDKVTICAVGTAPPLVDKGLTDNFTVTRDASEAVRGVAVCGGHTPINAAFVERFPSWKSSPVSVSATTTSTRPRWPSAASW